jgi:hypothetical protein
VAVLGDVAVHRAVLLGGGRPCDGRRTHRQWHLGGRCGALDGVVGEEVAVRRTRHGGGGRGEKVVQRTTRGSWATVFRDNAVVQQAV